MTGYTIKRSTLSVEGHYRCPAVELFGSRSNLLSTLTSALSDFCPVQGEDIRIKQETNPLGNADVTYDLRSFNGFARVTIDRTRLFLLDPHTLVTEKVAGLSLALLDAVQTEIDDESYASFHVHVGLHAEVHDVEPAAHTGRYVSPLLENDGSAIGSSATYYFGPEGALAHSSVTIDMSDEFSECVFVRIALGYDGGEIASDQLPDDAMLHCNQLLALVGLESE